MASGNPGQGYEEVTEATASAGELICNMMMMKVMMMMMMMMVMMMMMMIIMIVAFGRPWKG